MNKNYYVAFGTNGKAIMSKIAAKLSNNKPSQTTTQDLVIEPAQYYFELPTSATTAVRQASSVSNSTATSAMSVSDFPPPFYALIDHQASYNIITSTQHSIDCQYALMLAQYLETLQIAYKVYITTSLLAPHESATLPSLVQEDCDFVKIFDLRTMSLPYKKMKYHQALDIIDTMIADDIVSHSK